VQVLISARIQWREDDCPFALHHASAELLSACETLGVPPDAIGMSSDLRDAPVDLTAPAMPLLTDPDTKETA